jgi:hypothetical protein
MSQVINDATSSLLVLRIEQKEKETEEFLYLQTNKPKKKKNPTKPGDKCGIGKSSRVCTAVKKTAAAQREPRGTGGRRCQQKYSP